MNRNAQFVGLAAMLAMVAAPLQAKEQKGAPELVRCEASIGTIALVEGDQAGWTEWGLSSPRALLNTLATESGCFTIDNPNDTVPARFLVTAIAGHEQLLDCVLSGRIGYIECHQHIVNIDNFFPDAP